MKKFKRNKFWSNHTTGYLPDILPKPLKATLIFLCQYALKFGNDAVAKVTECWNNYVNAYWSPTIDATTKRLEMTKAAFPDLPNETLERALNTDFTSKEAREEFLNAEARKLRIEKGITSTKLSQYLATKKLQPLLDWVEQYKRSNKDLPVTPSGMDNRTIYVITVVVLFCFELPFSLAVLQNTLPLPMILIYVVACLVSSLFFLSSHFATKAIIQRNYNVATLALSVGILSLITQVALRLTELEGSQAVLAFLNVALFLCNILVSFFHNWRRDYWDAQRSIHKLTQKLKKLDAMIKKNNLDRELIEVRSQQKVNKNADKRTSKAISRAKKDYEQHKDIVEVLENELIDFQESKDATIAYGNAEIEAAPYKSDHKRKQDFKTSSAAATLLILLSVFLGNCGDKDTDNTVTGIITENVITKETTQVRDISQSGIDISYPDAVAMSNHVINEVLDLDNKQNLFNGAIVNLSTIAATGLPKIETYRLPEGNANKLMRNQVERQKTVDSFIRVLKAAIERFAGIPATATSTNLHRAACYQLKQLTASDADEKTIYFYSDGLEESTLISFSAYLNQGLFQSSHEKIAGIMNAACEVGDMQNKVHIYLIANPENAAASDVIMATNAYWSYFYETHGANVTINTSVSP